MGAQKMPKASRTGPHQKTLDMEHTDSLTKLHSTNLYVNQLDVQRAELREEVGKLEGRARNSLSEFELENLLALKDRCKALDQQIEMCKHESDEVEYYLNTGEILFNYYEIIDKGLNTPPPEREEEVVPAAPVRPLGQSTTAQPQDQPPGAAASSQPPPPHLPVLASKKKNSIMKYFCMPAAPVIVAVADAAVDKGVDDAAVDKGVGDVDDAAVDKGVGGVDDAAVDKGFNNIPIDATDELGPSKSIVTSLEMQMDEGPPPAINLGNLNIRNSMSSHRVKKSGSERSSLLAGTHKARCKGGHGRHPGHHDRATLLEKYLMNVDKDYIRLEQVEEADANNHPCHFCGSLDRTIILHDGYTFCNGCFTVEYVLVDHEKPSYKEPPKEITYFSYKRINHFNEWLNQIQGKETTEIPEEIYDKILLEIKKQKITNMASLTSAKVRDILKKLKINKYYEHTPHIINRLSGISMPHITPELEDRLRHMFCQIQVPFLKHSPPTRKNFLSYSYVLHKFMQLLEKDQFLSSFPLLKSRDKLLAQDAIWGKICAELGWEFVRSL